MDTQRDGAAFRALMQELCAALRDGFKASEPMMNAYWTALKDVALSEVRANVNRIIATATTDTPFPRPASLRNRPPRLPMKPSTAEQERAERASIHRWDELRKEDPVRWEIEFRSARAFQAMVGLDEADPGYEDLLFEFRRWDRLRFAPRPAQEAAVAHCTRGLRECP